MEVLFTDVCLTVLFRSNTVFSCLRYTVTSSGELEAKNPLCQCLLIF